MSILCMDDCFRTLDEFTHGSLSAEECFGLMLSFLGEEQTKLQFYNLLSAQIPTNGPHWKRLNDIYTGYFTSESIFISESAPNEYESFGDQLDLEFALALSVADQRELSGTYTAIPSYASKIKASQICETNAVSREKHFEQGIKPRRATAHSKYCEKENKTTSQNENRMAALSGTGDPQNVKQEDQYPDASRTKRKKKKKKIQQSQYGPMRPIPKKPVIYWLRRDLRLHDNPALLSSFESDAPVILTFLWNEKEEGPLAAGGATKYWLHFALSALDTSIRQKYNNSILFRKTESSCEEIMSLVSETGAGTVILNNLYEPCLRVRDDQISKVLSSHGVEVKRYDSYLLHEPDSVSTESKGLRGFGSVLHFMECCRQSHTQPIGLPVDKPPVLPTSASMPHGQHLEELGLARLPKRKDGTIIDWAKIIRESWDFSEDGAWTALELFVEGGIRNYEKESGRADMLNTSRISPYLHFGQISPRAVLRYAQGLRSPKFLRKLAWRDLSYWLLTKFPDMPSKPIRVHYQSQRWSENKSHLKAWQKGQTGYPLVDAAMRQLWLTGWMNNYTRHVVASFLISYLHLNWVHGYNWFQDTLLDADVAINAMMWQNGGMSGLDQWNFVMHPVDAALTCDPNGQYIRQWCPELSGLPDDFIHKPWKCPPSMLRRAGVELGKNYPDRIVTDLEAAREQSLQDVVSVRLQNPQFVDPMGNDLVPLESGRLLPVITRHEFKYKTFNPQSKDNPHTAVLRGYRSRKRDEAIAFANQVDFTASTLNECAMRHKRNEESNRFIAL